MQEDLKFKTSLRHTGELSEKVEAVRKGGETLYLLTELPKNKLEEKN